jgi:hypothetical protein
VFSAEGSLRFGGQEIGDREEKKLRAKKRLAFAIILEASVTHESTL